MKNKSFTLIELLVVIVIIGILAGVIMISTSSLIDKANIAKSKVFEESVQNNLAADMVSRWKLDEIINVNQTPDAWENNNGTLVNSPILKNDSDCIADKCFGFNGSNSYIDCGNNESLDITTKITISAWVKYSVVGSTHDSWIAVKKGLSWDDNGYGLFFGYSSDLYFTLGNSGSTSLYARYNVPNATSRGWMFILGVYDGINAKLYFDGSEVNSQNPSHGLISNTQPLLIGGKTTIYPLNGLIDDVRVYSGALSSSQIKQNYVAGLDSLFFKGLISKAEYNDRLLKLNIGN
ncbi:MAG TPA: prepilin-type N-terminal cleavage/methylation domain-containing protein [Candidatus Pacearchaeota archaeon]|nr:prepilin-type N-terminal cleavage/methylation domain-containing protein [Candidatus Pacearchaeota archaeon]